MELHTSFDNRREKAITEEHEIIFFLLRMERVLLTCTSCKSSQKYPSSTDPTRGVRLHN